MTFNTLTERLTRDAVNLYDADYPDHGDDFLLAVKEIYRLRRTLAYIIAQETAYPNATVKRIVERARRTLSVRAERYQINLDKPTTI